MKRTTIAGLALIAAIALLTLTGCPEAGPLPNGNGTSDPLETLEGWWLATNTDTGEVELDIVVEATATHYWFYVFNEGELFDGSVYGTYQITESAIVTTDAEEYDKLAVNWFPAEDATAESRAYTYNATAQTVRFAVDGVAVTFAKVPAPTIDEDIVGWWEAGDFGNLELDAESYSFAAGGFSQSGSWSALAGHIFATITYQEGGMFQARVMAPGTRTNSLHRYTYSSGADQLTMHFPDGDVMFGRIPEPR